MAIELEASRVYPAPPDAVFSLAAGTTANLARFFTGYPPLIPGISQATLVGGEPPTTGALRAVKLSDGTEITERLLAFEPPTLHRYDMAEMNALQRVLCTNMISEWRFVPEGSGTRIVWRYTILPKPLRTPLAWVVGRLFQRAMTRCLDNLAAALG